MNTEESGEDSLTFANGGPDMEESSEDSLVFANGGLDRCGKRPMDRYMTAMESLEGTCMSFASPLSFQWLIVFFCLHRAADQPSLQHADFSFKHAHQKRSCQEILSLMGPSTSPA